MTRWLCLDIGNTHTVAGLYCGPERLAHVRYRTDPGCTGDEYRAQLRQLFGDKYGEFDRVIVSSVVPALRGAVRDACSGSPLLWVGHDAPRDFDLDLPMPAQLGADRLANVAGALTLAAPGPLLIVDAGTATTFCAVAAPIAALPGSRPSYIGGAIVPGLEIGWKALQARAAQLFAVELRRPESTLGRDTESQLQSGVLLGYESLIEGMADRVLADGARAHGARFANPVLIATGGCVKLLRLSPRWRVEPDLTLMGLLRYGQLS